jgi:hypothetical protein
LRFLTDRRRHFMERTPQCAAYVRPQTLDANRGHSDKEWCGYISVRVLKPTDIQSLIWLKNNSPCGEIMVGCACTNAQAETLRIPIYSGRVFRREAGPRSDLKPATIPK